MDKTAVAVFSGGLDSTTMLYQAIENGWDLTSAVSFNYGQRHKKELVYAEATCAALDIKHHVIDLWSSGLTGALAPSGSSLVSDTEVPDGHYAEDSMKATVVPNRNMIMIAIAGGIAVAEDAQCVMTGVHAGDHFIYPDCRPEFISAAANALVLGNVGFGQMQGIMAPFLTSTKADIAYEALMLNLAFEDTWSCYKGGDVHCGRCGTCVERLEAIDEAMKRFITEFPDEPLPEDKTVYADNIFWMTAGQ